MTDNANPLGLDGFAFCEFTGAGLGKLFEQLGFRAEGQGDVRHYRQGRSTLLLNERASGHAADFYAAHGPSACGFGLRVADPRAAYDHALRNGATPADPESGALGAGSFVIAGVGGANLYLVEATAVSSEQSGIGLVALDHLTHNLRRGQMRLWSDYYARLFGFAEQRYFDIKGKATGLFSQAMIAPDGRIRIPLNESQDEASQIEEFIREYRGEGIQHLAFATDDIFATVEALRARGVRLQDTPDCYYEQVDARVPGHGEDLERLRRNRILIDGDVAREGILLQIFTEPMIGPIFFEIIQRKGNEGFGAGNFQALFESIELDQIRRGTVKAGAGMV